MNTHNLRTSNKQEPHLPLARSTRPKHIHLSHSPQSHCAGFGVNPPIVVIFIPPLYLPHSAPTNDIVLKPLST